MRKSARSAANRVVSAVSSNDASRRPAPVGQILEETPSGRVALGGHIAHTFLVGGHARRATPQTRVLAALKDAARHPAISSRQHTFRDRESPPEFPRDCPCDRANVVVRLTMARMSADLLVGEPNTVQVELIGFVQQFTAHVQWPVQRSTIVSDMSRSRRNAAMSAPAASLGTNPSSRR